MMCYKGIFSADLEVDPIREIGMCKVCRGVRGCVPGWRRKAGRKQQSVTALSGIGNGFIFLADKTIGKGDFGFRIWC
jgi:hypothetical protein